MRIPATLPCGGCPAFVGIAFVSVIWQVLKAAKTNPAKALEKE